MPHRLHYEKQKVALTLRSVNGHKIFEILQISYKYYKDEYFWVCPTKSSWSLVFDVVGIAFDGGGKNATKFPLYWTEDHY